MKYILLALLIYFGWKGWNFFSQISSIQKPRSSNKKASGKKDISKLDIKDATFTDIDE